MKFTKAEYTLEFLKIISCRIYEFFRFFIIGNTYAIIHEPLCSLFLTFVGGLLCLFLACLFELFKLKYISYFFVILLSCCCIIFVASIISCICHLFIGIFESIKDRIKSWYYEINDEILINLKQKHSITTRTI